MWIEDIFPAFIHFRKAITTKHTVWELSHAVAIEGVNLLTLVSSISGPSPGVVRLSLRRSRAWTILRPAKAWDISAANGITRLIRYQNAR